MPTTVTDQFYTFDPADPPPAGTYVSVTKLSLTDQNDDGDIDEFDNDVVDVLDVTASWPSDTVTINVAGVGNVTYEGTTLYLDDGSIIFTPTDGQVLQEGTFVSSTYVMTQGPLLLDLLGPPCFLPGTLIWTPHGKKAVEALAEGDLVITADRGASPVIMVRRRTLDQEHLAKLPRHGPIHIPASAFGPGLPSASLLVSPQHRMLIRSPIALRMFGVEEVLVPAAQLLGHFGIARADVTKDVQYLHILLDHHGVVLANDLPCESLFLGQNTVKELRRDELLLCLKKKSDLFRNTMRPARPFVSGPRLRRLLERHAANGKPLLCPQRPEAGLPTPNTG